MATESFIPVGRTSMTKQGDTALQVQTEYAPRPTPRITTTITHEGRVINKIERNLAKAIESGFEQSRVERTLRKQHSEILGIIQKRRFPGVGAPAPGPRAQPEAKPEVQPEPEPVKESAPAEPEVQQAVDSGGQTKVKTREPQAAHREDPQDELEMSSASPDAEIELEDSTVFDRLKAIPGVRRIYRLDPEGNFIGKHEPTRFKQAFAMLFKNLQDLIDVFAITKGVGTAREKGVYEVEPDHVYFASAGYECFFVIVARVDLSTDYEKAISTAISTF